MHFVVPLVGTESESGSEISPGLSWRSKISAMLNIVVASRNLTLFRTLAAAELPFLIVIFLNSTMLSSFLMLSLGAL